MNNLIPDSNKEYHERPGRKWDIVYIQFNRIETIIDWFKNVKWLITDRQPEWPDAVRCHRRICRTCGRIPFKPRPELQRNKTLFKNDKIDNS